MNQVYVQQFPSLKSTHSPNLQFEAQKKLKNVKCISYMGTWTVHQ